MDQQLNDTSYYQNQWHKWDDMKSFGPMSRHVRQIINKFIKPLNFETVLDVGCGVGTLLADIQKLNPKASLNGTELFEDSLKIARKKIPTAQFHKLDLTKASLPKKFDLTLCIDVFEHIKEDEKAMGNLFKMTDKYALIVVPLGPLFEIETKRVGHVHGYSKSAFDKKLKTAGFEVVKSLQWGFPFYNLYRRLLHRLPESTTTGKYSWKKKISSLIIYFILSLNIPSPFGERYFVLCKPNKK